jgi:hypothetical protein
VFAHKTNKSWKLLLKTRQTGLSGLANRLFQFDRLRRQSGAPSAPAAVRGTVGFGEGIFSWPNGISLGRGTRSMTTQEVVVVVNRSNEVK